MSRRVVVVACGVVLATAGGVAVLGLHDPRTTSAGGMQDIGEAAMGVSFSPATDASSEQPAAINGVMPISKSKATSIAEQFAEGPTRPAGATTSIVASFGTFTDRELGKNPTSGQTRPFFERKAVWLVTVSGPGVQILSSGPMGGVHTVNHEENVVIDALTGKFLESFTYR